MIYQGTYKFAINLMGGSGLTVDEHVGLLRRIGWDGFFTGWNREKLGEFRAAVEKGIEIIPAKVIRKDGTVEDITLYLKGLTPDEKEIILDGCLMNYYARRMK